MFGAANRREVLGMESPLQHALRQYEGPKPDSCSSCRGDPRVKTYYYRNPETGIVTYGCCPDVVGRQAGVGRNHARRTGSDPSLWNW